MPGTREASSAGENDCLLILPLVHSMKLALFSLTVFVDSVESREKTPSPSSRKVFKSFFFMESLQYIFTLTQTPQKSTLMLKTRFEVH